MNDEILAEPNERLVAFVELVDDLMAIPWAARNAEVEWRFVATDERGHGTWTLAGPSELELKVLALDIRNVMQPRSDLAIPKVLDDLSKAVPDAELRRACSRLCVQFRRARSRGMSVENDKPLEPWRVAELWFYGWYHHRNLVERRRLRNMDPLTRLVYRGEFLSHLGAVLQVVVEVCNLITAAKERGYLTDVPLARLAQPPA